MEDSNQHKPRVDVKIYLPIGKKDDRLNDHKLGDRIERLEKISARHVKQNKRVQSHRVGYGVDDGKIEIRLVRVKVPILVLPFCVEHKCYSH